MKSGIGRKDEQIFLDWFPSEERAATFMPSVRWFWRVWICWWFDVDIPQLSSAESPLATTASRWFIPFSSWVQTRFPMLLRSNRSSKSMVGTSNLIVCLFWSGDGLQYNLLQLQDYSVGSGDYAHLIAHSVELLVDEGVHDRIDFRFSSRLLIILTLWCRYWYMGSVG